MSWVCKARKAADQKLEVVLKHPEPSKRIKLNFGAQGRTPTMKPFTEEDVEFYIQNKVSLCVYVSSLSPQVGMVLKSSEFKDWMLV